MAQRWGYHPAHGARLFVLPPAAALPAGWSDVPHAGQHPHDIERGIAAPPNGEHITTSASTRRRTTGRMR